MGEEDYEYDDGIFKYVSPAMVKACHNQMWPKNNKAFKQRIYYFNQPNSFCP